MPKQTGKIRSNVAGLFAGLGDHVVEPVGDQQGSSDVPAADQVIELPIDEIRLDPVQVRYMMGVADLRRRREAGNRWARQQLEELQSLGEHMREHGQIQPIRVFRTTRGRPYQVLAGHRRVMAAELIGMTTVRAIVLPEEPDELENLDLQVGENVHRRNFNDMERALIYERFTGAIARPGRPKAGERVAPAIDEAEIAAR